MPTLTKKSNPAVKVTISPKKKYPNQKISPSERKRLG